MDSNSPGLAFLSHVWYNACQATRFSWRKYNSALRGALWLAVESGMRFQLDDFSYISRHYRPGYWMENVEDSYSRLVHSRNLSAIRSFEKWIGRKPFIADNLWYPRCVRGRLCVGARFPWKEEQVVVTSFGRDGTYLIACTHVWRRWEQPEEEGDPAPRVRKLRLSYEKKKKVKDGPVKKVRHRYKITHKALLGARKGGRMANAA